MPPEDPQPSSESQLTQVLRELNTTLEAQRPADEHFVIKLIKQLGTLLTAGAVIGLIGKLVGASDVKVAALTLWVVATLYLVIYRERIQRRVNSSTLLVGVVAIVALTIFFSRPLMSFFLDRTISKATGIIEFSPKANDFLPRLPELIEGAQEEVWFTGISFYISLPAYKDTLLKKLEEGISVRFLIYNPLSSNVDDVASGFAQTRQELLSECDVTIQNLRTLSAQAKAHNTRGQLEVRLFSSIPKMRVYVFDRHREEGLSYFIPHVDQQNSPNVPGFLAKNIKTGIAPSFIEGIERVWTRSEPFETFLIAYDQRARSP